MRIRSILVILVMLASSSFAQDDFPDPLLLVNRSHTQRTVLYADYYTQRVCNDDSVIVFSIVNTLLRVSEEQNDPELTNEAILLRAHYFFCNTVLDAGIILSELDAALRKAEERNSLWLRIRIESMLGFVNCNRLKQYEQGLIHLTRAANLMDDKPSSEYPLKQVCNYHVGFQLLRFEDYNNALVYLNKAAKVDVPKGMKDHRYQLFNALGLIYRKMNRLTASDSCFVMAKRFSEELSDSSWVAITSGNLGENHLLRGELNEAYPLLQLDAMMAQKNLDWGLASNSLALMADIRLKQGNTNAADSLLTLARKFAYRSGNYQRLHVVYPRLAKLYAAKGNALQAQLYIDSSLYVNDSLERATNSMRSARAEQKVQIEQLQAMAEQQNQERTRQIMLRNSIIVVLFLLMVIVALLFNRHRLKLRERQLKLEADRSHAEQRLDQAIKRLNALAYEKKKNADKDTNERSLSDGVQQLENAVILTDKDWRDFSETFEGVHPGFFVRLNEKFPGLTSAETRFMVLKRLQFSVKEMSVVLGVSAEAIRQMRYRIKKKLHLGKEDDLGELVRYV